MRSPEVGQLQGCLVVLHGPRCFPSSHAVILSVSAMLLRAAVVAGVSQALPYPPYKRWYLCTHFFLSQRKIFPRGSYQSSYQISLGGIGSYTRALAAKESRNVCFWYLRSSLSIVGGGLWHYGSSGGVCVCVCVCLSVCLWWEAGTAVG